MRIFFVAFSLFFSFLLMAQEVKMSSAEIADFKLLMERETKKITSIQTDFNQEKHLAFLSDVVKSSGKMYMTNKGNLKWEYLTPNLFSFTFKNGVVTINDNGKKSQPSGGKKMFGKLSELIYASVIGKVFNDTEFDVTYFNQGKFNLVKLKAKDKRLVKYIKEVHLTFPKGEATVSEVRLIEPSNDFTQLKFINKKINTPISPSVFND